MPTFSVLIAAYDAAATIAETLDSLRMQTRDDWEAIVADDGSADATAAIAALYAARDPRIRVVSKPNGGTGSARNVAAIHASGSFLCLLDADDLYLPEYIERMGRFVDEHPGFDIYSADGYIFYDDGSIVPDDLQPDSCVRSYMADDLLVRNRIRVHSVFRREVFDRIGGFDEDPRLQMEDYDFWLRALLSGARHIHNPERLWEYRRTPGAKTAGSMSGTLSDILMFQRLIAGGGLTDSRLRTARATLRRLVVLRKSLEATNARRDLQRRLAEGNLEGMRAIYWRGRRAYTSRLKFFLGLPVVIASPRLFAWLAPRVSAPVSDQPA